MKSGYIYLVLAMLAWGFSNPFSDLALEHIPLGQMFLIEIGTGVLVLSLFFKKAWRQLPWRAIAVLGLLQPGLTYFFGNLGYTSGTVSTGLIIMSSEVLLLAIFGWLWLKEKLNLREALALLIGFSGAVIAGYSATTDADGSVWSNLYFGLAATAAAGYAVVIRKLAVDDAKIDVVGLAWGQALVSFGLALATFPITTSLDTGTYDYAAIGFVAAIGSGIFGVALPFVWYARAAVTVSTGHAAVSLNLIPIFGIAIGAVLGRGLPTSLQLLGGLLVFASVFAIQNQSKRR